MIKFAELIPLMCGGWAVGLEGDGDDIKPYFYDTEAEVIEEIKSMQEEYDQQIAEGFRDEGDLWEGEAHQVTFIDDVLTIVETGEKIEWRDQL